MLKVRIIPCMLFDGKAIVKTKSFQERRTLGNPIQFARVYNSRNVDELVFVDIAATSEGREPLYNVVESVSQQCFMPLSIGGGIHNILTIKKLLQIGADKVLINSGVVEDSNLIEEAVRMFGSQCIVVSIDVKKEADNTYGVYINNGKLKVSNDVVEYARKVEARGAGELFITSIDNDGMMGGYDTDLLKLVSDVVNIPVVASGGAGEPRDVVDVMQETSVSAVSMASIFHYTHYTPDSVKQELNKNNFPVRKVA